MRPGRADGLATEVEGDDDLATATPAAQPAEPETTNLPAASEPPAASGLDSATPAPQSDTQQAAQQGEAPAEPVLRILPLGSGLVLIGLGLGLALLGLRLRRN
jgi:pyruvate/2-oxoglutarate dehydrogenase complex dihydrolipoamide acyltransferase (E2) component